MWNAGGNAGEACFEHTGGLTRTAAVRDQSGKPEAGAQQENHDQDSPEQAKHLHPSGENNRRISLGAGTMNEEHAWLPKTRVEALLDPGSCEQLSSRE